MTNAVTHYNTELISRSNHVRSYSLITRLHRQILSCLNHLKLHFFQYFIEISLK